MKKREFSNILLLCAIVVCMPFSAFAVCLTQSFGIPCCAQTNMAGGGICSAPAQTYKFTIDSFGFEDNNGTVVSLGSPTVFDAASADASNVMGKFISGVALPAGTYVAVRPSIQLSQTVSTNVTTLDGRTCSGSVTSNINAGGAPNCAAGQPNSSVRSCISGTEMAIRDTSLGNMVVTNTSNLQVAFTFNTQSGALCTFTPGVAPTSVVAPGPLQVTMQLLSN